MFSWRSHFSVKSRGARAVSEKPKWLRLLRRSHAKHPLNAHDSFGSQLGLHTV
ncbi:hypothetical protein BDA96_04G376300 [Sorghum bicolor]|uniref:Uncharacterized protein n=2 Tax=Sorghum bicolor TaxID=4558 RepID=A0A921R7Z1_SORBI|nr:hypothetical protein BDA96_04G376300 [Sorghum bicolor]KXG31395.1 hypothetical protein SORBI_3004G351000 [Sorghum bicolor]